MEQVLESGQYYKINLDSRSESVGTAIGLEECLARVCAATSLRICAYMNRRDQFVELPAGGLTAVLPSRKLGSGRLMLSETDDVELGYQWIPPEDPILLSRFAVRLELRFTVDKARGSAFATQLLTESFQASGAFWAELIDFALIGKPSFARWNSHGETVPNLGCANCFGPEYVRLFGGLQKLRAAGFAEVSPIGDGVYVSLGQCGSRDEFLRKQADVAARLGPPGVIGGERRTPFVPQFGP